VLAGQRLERPTKCPAEVYQLMLDCWDAEPPKRPSFEGVIERFKCVWGLLRCERG